MKFRLTAMILTLMASLVMVPAAADAGTTNSDVCAKAAAHGVKCLAKVLRRAGGNARTSSPVGYGPSQLRSAYDATLTGGSLVAVVDAYHDSSAKAELDTYDTAFGLDSFPTCTSSGQTGCFAQVDQRGGTNFGSSDSGWALETALDIETAHQMCPGCRLELVEADSASFTNLLAAVDTAVARGAKAVSMSWGAREFSSETGYDSHFNHSGVVFTSSAGDSGYGVSYPAASRYVVAVGGTHLVASTTAWQSETTWSGTGSGCSRYETKPSWQTDSGCARRTVNDVSADADPSTGAAIYSALASGGAGWYTVGGTSLAAPIVAALAAGANQTTGVAPSLYSHAGSNLLHDITSGRDGYCTKSYLCQARTGYDGPTGVGSPASAAVW